MTEKTIGVFRKFKDGGDILALFPEIDEGHGMCLSYQHIGQHGASDYNHCISLTWPAQPHECADLKAELEGIGYNLDIRKRYTRRRHA